MTLCGCGRAATGVCQGCDASVCDSHAWTPRYESRDALGHTAYAWNLPLENVTPAQRPALEDEAQRLDHVGLHCVPCVIAHLAPIADAVRRSHVVPDTDEGRLRVVYTPEWNMSYPAEVRDQVLASALEKAQHDKKFRQVLYRGVDKRSLGGFPFLRVTVRAVEQQSGYGDQSGRSEAVEWRSYRLTADGDVLEVHVSKGHLKKRFGKAEDLHEERLVDTTAALASAMLLSFGRGETLFQ